MNNLSTSADRPLFVYVDHLPQSSSVSALVRRIVWRLDGHLAMNKHPTLSTAERAALFDLGEASKLLDRIATLPGMAQHEESARGRLLDIYNIFDPDPLESTTEVALILESPPCQDFAPNGFAMAVPDCPASPPCANWSKCDPWDCPRESQAGFTLIELMIVVCIIGILAAIAIPAYSAYVGRSQLTEGLSLVSGLKPAIAEHYAITGQLPESLDDIASDVPSGKYVDSIDFGEGVLLIRYGGESTEGLKDEAHNTLALAIGISGGAQSVWQCGLAAKPGGASIDWSGDASEFTTIEARYLPANCR